VTVERQYRDHTSVVQLQRQNTVDVETTCRHLDGAEVGFRCSDDAEHHRRAGRVEVGFGTLRSMSEYERVSLGLSQGSFEKRTLRVSSEMLSGSLSLPELLRASTSPGRSTRSSVGTSQLTIFTRTSLSAATPTALRESIASFTFTRACSASVHALYSLSAKPLKKMRALVASGSYLSSRITGARVQMPVSHCQCQRGVTRQPQLAGADCKRRRVVPAELAGRRCAQGWSSCPTIRCR